MKVASSRDVDVVALGAAKSCADYIVIDGDVGGTASGSYSDIYNTGLPWEVGVALAHKLLKQEGLRSQMKVIASGGIKSGEGIIKAILLGADSVEIGTSALITLGCSMIRQCHKDRIVTTKDIERHLKMTVVGNKHFDVKEDQLEDLAHKVMEQLIVNGQVNLDGSITHKFNIAEGDQFDL